MIDLEKQKIIEVVLYILNKAGGMDYYHLFKILYFANQRSLVEWGQLMISDKFCALPHGPVPTELYNAIKGQRSVIPNMKNDINVVIIICCPNGILTRTICPIMIWRFWTNVFPNTVR